MKSLLTAIKTQLQTELSDVRDADIFIAPHINFIPAAVRMPCVGIKDGTIVRQEQIGGYIAETYQVQLAVYVNSRKDEAAIMGDESVDQKGVLDMVAEVHSALHQQLMNLSGVISAFCSTEQASEMFGDDTATVVRKIIIYQYEKE